MTRRRSWRGAALALAAAVHAGMLALGSLRAGEAPGAPAAETAGAVSVTLTGTSALAGGSARALPAPGAAAAAWVEPVFPEFPPLPEPLTFALAAPPAQAAPAAETEGEPAESAGASGPGRGSGSGGGADDPWARASLTTWAPPPCDPAAATRDPACPDA